MAAVLNNQKGFLLISVIFIMLLMAVTVFSINYYSATQLQMASNQISSVQTDFDLKASVEDAVRELTKNPFRRTSIAGEDYPPDSKKYTRIVLNSNTNPPFTHPAAYADAVTIQVTPKGSTQSFQRSFRYYIKELSNLSLLMPEKISVDALGKLLIVDSGHHKVLEVDTETLSIKIIAGTGIAGEDNYDWFWGSSRPKLNNPKGACSFLSGSINYYYIADTGNHRIGRIRNFEGYLQYVLIAGNGSPEYSGDRESSTSAGLDSPKDVFKDPLGNIYIADTQNHCIRRVDSDWEISTVAGTGIQGDSGNGIAATTAKLKLPISVFLDSSGNLYIADMGNNKIKMVNTSGIITTVAGGGIENGEGASATSAQLNSPQDVFVDGNNNIFIADQGNNKVRVVNAEGKIYTLAGTGTIGNTKDIPAAEAMLNAPSSITTTSSNSGRRIYISDKNNNTVKFLLWKITPDI